MRIKRKLLVWLLRSLEINFEIIEIQNVDTCWQRERNRQPDRQTDRKTNRQRKTEKDRKGNTQTDKGDRKIDVVRIVLFYLKSISKRHTTFQPPFFFTSLREGNGTVSFPADSFARFSYRILRSTGVLPDRTWHGERSLEEQYDLDT